MIDRYTKVCLTVIAVSLAVIGLRGLPLIDSAWAKGVLHSSHGVQKVMLCDRTGKRCPSILRVRQQDGAETFNLKVSTN